MNMYVSSVYVVIQHMNIITHLSYSTYCTYSLYLYLLTVFEFEYLFEYLLYLLVPVLAYALLYMRTNSGHVSKTITKS